MSASNALVFSFKTLFVPRCLSVGSVNRTLAAYRRQYHTLKTGPEPGDKIVEIAEVCVHLVYIFIF